MNFRLLTFAPALLIAQSAAAQTAVTPERVKAALPELEKLTTQWMRKTGVPGVAIAVVHRDEAVFLKGFGVRQVGKDGAIDPDTVFQIASMSKPITSTVLAALVGEKFIHWDDRVIDRDPGFRLLDPWATREVTLRDLLCHRSGLPDHAGDLLEDVGYSRDEVLHRLRFMKPASSFRSKYAYTNFAFTEAGVASAQAAGKSWEDLSAEKLFRPLGMSATSSRFADFVAASNRAHGHQRVGDRWEARRVRDPDAQSPAGGVSSTVRDLARWVRLQLGSGKFEGRQLIAAEALGETHRPNIVSRAPASPNTDRAGFYGLGWNVSYDDSGRVRLGHSGAFDMGAATVVVLLPSERLGIVVLTNSSPIGLPEAIAESFLDLALTGKTQRDWLAFFGPLYKALEEPATRFSNPPTAPSPALTPETYIGKYDNNLYGDAEVSVTNGGLELRLGPKKSPYALKHWHRDTFIYQPTGEMAAGPSGVTFCIGPDRKAISVTIEHLDVHGQGTFRRRSAGR